ncbi:MAG: hypothetical protein A2W19_07465 [Spirochaetes bacterium RBG_16_49_21]|nr:MAG: hypothetical protein A2W19_07465 [Spirochaetes bacterium RBG_16_49_21]
MKKFVYGIFSLSAAGAIISGILIFQHYNPDSSISRLFCGDGLANPCRALAESDYSTLFGMPVASYGLVYYLLVLFIILIADYADGRYYAYSLASLLPLSAVAVAADIALGIVLIAVKLPCWLCLATYLINLGILALLIIWHRKMKAGENWSLPGLYREIFSAEKAPADRKAFYASFVLFAFLLPFSIFSTAQIVKLKTALSRSADDQKLSARQITGYITDFYNQPVEKAKFPDTGMAVGNPKAELSIIVFSDFLCSYCYKFYLVEEFLLSKYKNKIKIIYYNFPLDRGCNPALSRTIYRNSCTASRAFLAASEAGILEHYMKKHFSQYQSLDHAYDSQKPLDVLKLMDTGERRGIDSGKFRILMNSAKTARQLEEHIKLANKLGINGTPTIFISNRKIDGFRPAEVLDTIINIELGGRKALQ